MKKKNYDVSSTRKKINRVCQNKSSEDSNIIFQKFHAHSLI